MSDYRRVYYDTITGETILTTMAVGQHSGVRTVGEDIVTFKPLSERNRSTFDVIELSFGDYQEDFAQAASWRVDVNTRQLLFSYPDPNAPTDPQPYQQPLSTRVAELESTINFILMGGI